MKYRATLIEHYWLTRRSDRQADSAQTDRLLVRKYARNLTRSLIATNSNWYKLLWTLLLNPSIPRLILWERSLRHVLKERRMSAVNITGTVSWRVTLAAVTMLQTTFSTIHSAFDDIYIHSSPKQGNSQQRDSELHKLRKLSTVSPCRVASDARAFWRLDAIMLHKHVPWQFRRW
jgi:hypothetical protein